MSHTTYRSKFGSHTQNTGILSFHKKLSIPPKKEGLGGPQLETPKLPGYLWIHMQTQTLSSFFFFFGEFLRTVLSDSWESLNNIQSSAECSAL